MNKRTTFFFAAIFPVMLFAQWQKIPVDFEPLHIAVSDTGTIWSINANFQNRFTKSTDGGQSWTSIDVPDLLDESLYTATITAVNNNEAWVYFRLHATYEQYLYRTANGGQSWGTLPLPGDALAFFVKLHNSFDGLVLAWDGENLVDIRRTTNGGMIWYPSELTIDGSPLGVTTYSNRFVWLYTTSGILWHSTNNGATWTPYNTGIIAPNHGLAMAFRDNLNGMAVIDHLGNQIVKTTDGGATWTPVNALPNFPPNQNTFIRGISLIPDEPEGWIIGSDEGTVFTLDGGDTWTHEINFPGLDFSAPAFTGNQTAWSFAGSENAIFRWALPLDSSGTSGMASPQLSTQMKVLPNPSTGNITISLDHLPADPVTIMLRDLSGRTIRQFVPSPAGGRFLVENMQLPPGVYLVEVWNGKYRLAVEKVVILNK